MTPLVVEPVALVQVGVNPGSSYVLSSGSSFVVTVDSATRYDPDTVAKILAAKDGRNARAPKDAKAFLDWLNK
jgi:hypothetical protein